MSQSPTDSPYRWRAADLEGSRVALSIPTQVAAIRAINVVRTKRDGPKRVTGQGMGFEEFAWITPSEMIGTTIFTRSGGFIFKVVERRDPLECR